MRAPDPQPTYTPVPSPTVRRPPSDNGHPGYDRAPAVVWTPQPPAPLPAPAPLPPPPATAPVAVERPVARASGVSAYGVALAVGLAVAAGGLSFAAGRMTADEPSLGGGGRAPVAAGAGAGSGLAPGTDTGVVPGADAGLGRGPGDSGFATGSAPGTGAVDTALGSAPDIAAGAAEGSTGSTGASNDDPDAAGATPTDRSGGGFPSAGPGAFAQGGLEGTVGELNVGGFTLTTLDGGSLDIRIDDDTTYVRTATVSPDGIAVGDTVSVELAGAASDPTASSEAAAQPAASVTVVAPDRTGDTNGGPVMGGAPDAGGPGPMDGGPRGLRVMPTGTIDAIADGALKLTLADGRSIDVTTDVSTTFWQEEPSTAQEIVPGASVRVRPTFGGFQAPRGDPAEGTLTAGRVTLVDA